MPIIETSLLGLRTVSPPNRRDHRPYAREIWHRCGTIAIAAALLGGCVVKKGYDGQAEHSFIAADEPAAATIGREILQGGGTAGDVAAAAALMMAVTLPSRVGLAGGGVCVVFDPQTKETRTLDFLPRPSGSGSVPGFLRAIHILQATTGRLRWEQIVVPAEQAALRGFAATQALAADLAAWGGRLDAEARRALASGGPLVQTDLANTLSLIRRQGAGALYTGSRAADLAGALGVDAAGLRAYQPRWGGTVAVPVDPYELRFADVAEPGGGGALAVAWTAAADIRGGERIGRALAALGAGSGPAEAPGAGFAVIDAEERAVACTFTMGAPFGSGRTVSGFGVLAPVPVRSAGSGAPALLTNRIVGRATFAAAGVAAGNDGPAAGPAALLTAALPALVDERPAEEILSGRTTAIPGRVSLVTCQIQRETLAKRCQVAGDPRTPGLGYTVTREVLAGQ